MSTQPVLWENIQTAVYAAIEAGISETKIETLRYWDQCIEPEGAPTHNPHHVEKYKRFLKIVRDELTRREKLLRESTADERHGETIGVSRSSGKASWAAAYTAKVSAVLAIVSAIVTMCSRPAQEPIKNSPSPLPELADYQAKLVKFESDIQTLSKQSADIQAQLNALRLTVSNLATQKTSGEKPPAPAPPPVPKPQPTDSPEKEPNQTKQSETGKP